MLEAASVCADPLHCPTDHHSLIDPLPHFSSSFVEALSAYFSALSLSLADMAAVGVLTRSALHKRSLSAECQIGAHAVTRFFSLLRKVFNHSLDSECIHLYPHHCTAI